VEERELLALTRKHGGPQALAERVRIVLAASKGLSNKEIAGKLGCRPHTVGTWRNRFAWRRLDNLYDEPRPGAPRQIGAEDLALSFARRSRPTGCDPLEPGAMGKEIGHSPSTVRRCIWAFGLQPCSHTGSKRSTFRPSDNCPISQVWFSQVY
jgi:transposase